MVKEEFRACGAKFNLRLLLFLLDINSRADSTFLHTNSKFRVFRIERGRIRISLAFQGVQRLHYAVWGPEPLKNHPKIEVPGTLNALNDQSMPGFKMNRNHWFSLTPNLTLLIAHPGFCGNSQLMRFSPKPGISDEESQIWCQGQKFILFFKTCYILEEPLGFI